MEGAGPTARLCKEVVCTTDLSTETDSPIGSEPVGTNPYRSKMRLKAPSELRSIIRNTDYRKEAREAALEELASRKGKGTLKNGEEELTPAGWSLDKAKAGAVFFPLMMLFFLYVAIFPP